MSVERTPSGASLAPVAAEGASAELLAFELAGETYALPLSAVREIVRPPRVTEVPRAPAEVLGVISVRGSVTTLLDLRRRLALPEAALGPRTRVLLVDRGPEVIGVLVDAVLQVHRLEASEVELSNALGAQAPSHLSFIGRPLGADGRRSLLFVLDPSALLRDG